MTDQQPPEDVDQDSEAPVGAPATDPGGEPANPNDGSAEGRVDHLDDEAADEV